MSRIRRTRQPQGILGLDLTNPLCEGLVSACDARGWDYVTRSVGKLTFNADVTGVVSADYGLGQNFNNNRIEFPAVPGVTGDTNGSLLILAAPNLDAPWNSSGDFWSECAISHGMGIKRWFGKIGTFTHSTFDYWDFSTWTDIQPILLTVGADAFYSKNLYISGVSVANLGIDGGSGKGDDASIAINHLGGGTGDNYGRWHAPIYLILRWNRELSAQEATEISSNVWQIFAKPRRRKVAAVGASATIGIGAFSTATLSSLTASAVGGAVTSGAPTTAVTAVMSGLAAGGGLALASISSITTGVIAGSATGGATAPGALVTSAASTILAAATGDSLASGALSGGIASVITASAIGGGSAVGLFAGSTATEISGIAIGTSTGTGSGSFTTAVSASPTASATGGASASAPIATATAFVVTGVASGGAVASSSLTTSVATSTTASAKGSASAIAGFSAVSASSLSGSATGGASGFAVLPTAVISPMTGSASVDDIEDFDGFAFGDFAETFSSPMTGSALGGNAGYTPIERNRRGVYIGQWLH